MPIKMFPGSVPDAISLHTNLLFVNINCEFQLSVTKRFKQELRKTSVFLKYLVFKLIEQQHLVPTSDVLNLRDIKQEYAFVIYYQSAECRKSSKIRFSKTE